MQEVEKAISQINDNKSARADGMPPELFTDGGQTVATHLHMIFAKIWIDDVVPVDMRIVAAIRSSGRDDPVRSDDGFTLVKKRTRPSSLKTKAVIGTMGSSTVKAKTGRYVAVFVSRLLPETTAEEMEAFVQDTHHLSSKCVKLDTKHHSYASFKVEVTCDTIPDMYDPEKWPVGAYVRRYYNGAAF